MSEEQLAGIRGMGAVGIEELRNALQQQGLALPFSLQELRAVAPEPAGNTADDGKTSTATAPVSPRGARPLWSSACPVMPPAIVSCALSRRPRSMWLRIQRWAERIAALVDASRPKLVDGPQPHNHATAELPLD